MKTKSKALLSLLLALVIVLGTLVVAAAADVPEPPVDVGGDFKDILLVSAKNMFVTIYEAIKWVTLKIVDLVKDKLL